MYTDSTFIVDENIKALIFKMYNPNDVSSCAARVKVDGKNLRLKEVRRPNGLLEYFFDVSDFNGKEDRVGVAGGELRFKGFG